MSHAARGLVAASSALLICVAALGPANATPRTQIDVAAPAAASKTADPTKTPTRFGLYPQWIQRPYLAKKGNRFVVKASLLSDPYLTKATKSKRKDRLTVRIRVARPGKVDGSARRDVGMLPIHLLAARTTTKLKAKRSEPITVSVTLSKTVSRKLAKVAAATRRAAVSVVVEHRKDTNKWTDAGLVQVAVGPLTSAKFSKKRLERLERQARLKRTTFHRKPTAKGQAQGARLASTIGNEPWYNVASVANGSPFFQQINVNPNIQCMWTGSTPNANLSASVAAVGPQAVVQFAYPYTSNSSNQPGLAGATGSLNAPGTQGGMLQDLAQAGVSAGQTALGALTNPETYNEAGAIGAAASVAFSFVATVLKGVIDGTSSCNEVATYPELFGVTTTVTGFGTNNAATAALGDYPTPVTWSQLSGTTTQFSQSPGGTAAPTSAWLQENFASMLGAQTNATYYWNGGQASPMVSNNASGGSYVGGSATYQGGLFQFVGPNPGSPSLVSWYNQDGPQTSSANWSSNYSNCLLYPSDNVYDTCTMLDGYVPIQLGMISNPNSQGGLWIEGEPKVQFSTNPDGGYTIACQIPSTMEATFQVPFGQNGNSSALQASTLANTAVNSAGTLPTNANYNVSYFAMSDGQFVYYDQSVANPGPNGFYTPYLAPNAGQSTVSMGSNNIAQGVINSADLDDLVTWAGPDHQPVPVKASDIDTVGCTVTASVNMQGLDITNPNSPFGSNWPMPSGTSNGWPNNGSIPSWYYNFSWMTPVQQLNLTFQSMPVGNSVSVSSGS